MDRSITYCFCPHYIEFIHFLNLVLPEGRFCFPLLLPACSEVEFVVLFVLFVYAKCLKTTLLQTDTLNKVEWN